jgi:hypothetical protein
VSGQEDRPLKIATVGMDERMQNALRLFFKGPGKNSCILVEENSAELSIVDLDGYESGGLLEKHKQDYPDRPVILLSLQEQNMNGTIFLRKPLNPKQLASAVDKVKAQLSSNAQATSSTTQTPNEQQADIQDGTAQRTLDSAANQSEKSTAPKSDRKTHKAAMGLDERSAKAFIGSAHDINPNDEKQVSAAQYNPKDFFQYQLKRAFFLADSKARPVLLETEQGTMTFSPGSRPIRVEISDQWLRSLSVVPVIDGAVSISLINGHQVLHEDSPVLVSREELLWKTALWASRGRVPVGSSFTTPVFLRRWPNMPRLVVFPHALRIAALWVSKPHSLVNTAEVLNVPQRYVFAFYSAAHAIGLAASTERAVDTLFEPPPEHTHRRRSLFNRILNHLKGQ